MTKAEFLNHVRAIYAAANTADSDNKAGDWMRHEMAGEAGCRALDRMLHAMIKCGSLTEAEFQDFHDHL